MFSINKRQLITVSALLLFMYLQMQGVSQVHSKIDLKKNQRGFINKLIQIKYNSELYLITHTKEPAQKDTALAIYNTIRWNTDALVYQMAADMLSENSSRKYKQMNKWCLQHNTAGHAIPTNIVPYANQLTTIDNLYNELISTNNLDPLGAPKTLNLTTNVFYLIKDSWTVLKGIHDIKTQNTMAIVELLDQTRLISPLDLLKSVK